MTDCVTLPETGQHETILVDTFNELLPLSVIEHRDRWVAITGGRLIDSDEDLDELMERCDDGEGFVEYHFISDEVVGPIARRCVTLP